MTWMQFLRLLGTRRYAILGIALCFVASVLAISLWLPRQYSATTQVVVGGRPDPVAGILFGVAPSTVPTNARMITELDILANPRVALAVVDQLGIARDPEAIAAFLEATDGKGSIRHYFADFLQRRLAVWPSRQSNVINIGFTSTDPGFAALVTNAFARAYVDVHVAMKVEPAQRERRWLLPQAENLKALLDDAQQRLGEHLRATAIVSADPAADEQAASLQALSSQWTRASALATAARERRRLAQRLLADGDLDQLPEALDNPLLTQLKSIRATQEARLQEQSAVLGARHPTVQRAQEELRSTEARIRQELRTVAASLSQAAVVADRNAAELRAATEGQRRRVLEATHDRDPLTALQRDVDNAREAYRATARRLAQAELDSRSSPTDLYVLNPAEPPNEPASPDLPINAAAGAFVGLAFAIGVILALELLQRRVHGPEDLARVGAAPVLGRIRRPRRSPARHPVAG